MAINKGLLNPEYRGFSHSHGHQIICRIFGPRTIDDAHLPLGVACTPSESWTCEYSKATDLFPSSQT
jgi:hypothetical protein